MGAVITDQFRLLTRTAFPERFMDGSVLAFQEFLRKLNTGKDTSELLTPEFSKFLYQYLGSHEEPKNLEDCACVWLTEKGNISIRDVWLFLGPPNRFAQSKGKFGGLIKSKDTEDPKSKTLFLQLPFTSIVQTSRDATPLALHADSGLQIAVDVEIRAKFKFEFQGEEMTQDRVSVVRFLSQAFEGGTYTDTESRNRRIFSIRDKISWRISDIDYCWSTGENIYEE